MATGGEPAEGHHCIDRCSTLGVPAQNTTRSCRERRALIRRSGAHRDAPEHPSFNGSARPEGIPFHVVSAARSAHAECRSTWPCEHCQRANSVEHGSHAPSWGGGLTTALLGKRCISMSCRWFLLNSKPCRS
jgi:hypothetical protein